MKNVTWQHIAKAAVRAVYYAEQDPEKYDGRAHANALHRAAWAVMAASIAIIAILATILPGTLWGVTCVPVLVLAVATGVAIGSPALDIAFTDEVKDLYDAGTCAWENIARKRVKEVRSLGDCSACFVTKRGPFGGRWSVWNVDVRNTPEKGWRLRVHAVDSRTGRRVEARAWGAHACASRADARWLMDTIRDHLTAAMQDCGQRAPTAAVA